MQNITRSETSLYDLIGHVAEEIKILIKQEIKLAKTELSEKFSRFGRNAAVLGAGGFAAFAGLIILLAALSSLLSYAFESAGLSRSMAFFLGALIIGGGVAGLGIGFVLKVVKTFSQESLTPEKTVHSLKKLKSGEEEATTPERSHPAADNKPSTREIEARIDKTRKEVGETVEEIGERLTPHHMKQVVRQKIQAHPYRLSLIATATGFLGTFLIGRRTRHAKA